MGVRALGDEVEGCVADLDGEAELEVEETGLAAVAETGAGHADFCFAEPGFFLGHPSEYCGWTSTYLEDKMSAGVQIGEDGAYLTFIAVFLLHHA